jgi:hypothetical protein
MEKTIRAPIIFEERSHLLTWWRSFEKVLKFVKEENNRLASQYTELGAPPRVAISGSHVTTTSPDAVPFLLSIQTFMTRILRDEVPTSALDPAILPFKEVMVYDDGPAAASSKAFEWIVWAPKRIVEEGIEELRGEY